MPSGGYITISVTGLADRRRRLATWGTKIESLAPAWEQVAEDLRGDFAAQFAAQGGYYGKSSKWAPLKPGTVKDRIRLGFFGPAPILFRTGALFSSLVDPENAAHVEQITSTSLTIGTNYFTAPFHQLGTARMPARQVVGLSWNRQSAIVKRLNDYVQLMALNSGVEITGDGD
jgi:phage gpG-like protein